MKLRDKHSKGELTMSEKIVTLNEEEIKGQIKELVRGSLLASIIGNTYLAGSSQGKGWRFSGRMEVSCPRPAS